MSEVLARLRWKGKRLPQEGTQTYVSSRPCHRGHASSAQVAPQVVQDGFPRCWIGQPIRWAALAFKYDATKEFVHEHEKAAHRLFGPSNVGFLRVDKWQGLKFVLGGDRYWSEKESWRENAMTRTTRIGSQRESAE